MNTKFVQCGLAGWCLELFWTGLHSLLHHDPKLMGYSSLHMFPIYGLASLIAPLHFCIKKCRTWTRGLIYMLCIYSVEYLSGSYLKKHGRCPWDYSNTPFHIKGIIRLDYAPVWFCTGLFFEKILGATPPDDPGHTA